MKNEICMIGPDSIAKGAIGSVLEKYLRTELLGNYTLYFIVSHKNGNRFQKFYIATKGRLKFIYRCVFYKPNIVHVHSSFGESFYKEANFINIANFFSIPIINHIYGAEFDKFYTQATDKKRKLIKEVYSKCDSIIVLSKECKDKLCSLVEEERISIIENYVIYPNIYNKIKEDYSLQEYINKINEVYSKLFYIRDTKKVNIAGLLFDKLSINDACLLLSKTIDSNVDQTQSKIITVQAANVDSVVKAHRNDEMRRVTNKFDIILADGMPIVWASKLIRNPLIERVCGPDLFLNFNRIANIRKYRYYFLGSTKKTLRLIRERLNSEFPDIEIVGMYSPPFSDMKDDSINNIIFEKIQEARPHIVWVSFGCPKQETWIIDNKEYINASIICGIGAAFEFYAETIKRAPLWMQNSGLEWLYRFLQEPRRLGKRYFIEGPLFIKYFIQNRKTKDLNIN